MITREFKLYLNAGVGVAPVINANQFDQDEEWIFTLLQSDGTVYTPSTGAIIGLKQDGTTILNAGTVNSDGQVVITETEQMTAVPGSNLFEILIDGNTHGTANFVVFVERRPGDIDNPSESDISLFQEAITAAGNVTQFQEDISALQSGLSQETQTRQSQDTSLASQIAQEASARSQQDAVLQAEIDQIIAPSGEAPSAAEVQNARIGVDGTTYDTLGNAIRGQVSDLKNAFKLDNYKTLEDKDSTSAQRITTTGVPTASGSWTTYWFVNDGIYEVTCTVASSGTGDNAVSFFNSDTPSSSSYIEGVAIKNGTNTYSNILVPSNCKLIAISNRTDSYATPSAILSANMGEVAFNKVPELETELNTVKESIPDVRYIATDVDCDFTQACYITALTGVPHNSGSWKSYFFKNKGFTSVDCTVFLGSGDAAIAFYNDETASADTFISAVVSTVNNGTRSYTATVPSGCKLIAVCNRYASLANPVVKLYMPMESVYDKVFELEDEVDALSGKTDIISANEDIAYIVSSSSAKTGVDYNKIRHKYFSVLHGSDFHKDATNFQRMMEYAYKNHSNVDCVFATGDFKDHWAETDDGFTMTYGAYYQTAGVPVLPIIGNHETGYSPAVESVGGVVNTIANIDAKIITPYMSYNGCTQGNGGYYYRDFSDYNIRVIALNEYEMPRIVNPNDNTKYLYDYWHRYLSQTQVTWLCSALESVPEGYHVIIIMHMMPDKITEYMDNKFNSPNAIASDVYASAQESIVQDIVDAYISKTTLSKTYANTIGAPSTDVPDVTVNVDFTSANGEFIAYIVGHTHYDKVGKSSVAENTQTVVVVTTSGTTKAYYDDLWRQTGTKSQDCFNYLVFDTDAKRIRILRVGANSTLNMDWRDMTSISYI